MEIHFPNKFYEWPLVALFWLGGLWTVFYETYFVMCSYHQDWNEVMVKVHICCGLFLMLSIYANMFMMVTSDITWCSSLTADPKAASLKGWRHCMKCVQYSPPRSHHCKNCDVCILKRDHHCWFSGYCVGFQNHRFFICMVFYCTVASLYCNIYNWDFVLRVKGGFAWTTIPSLLAPHVGLVLGQYSPYEFFITMSTSIGTFVCFIFFCMFTTQLRQIYYGQVMHEMKKKKFEYSLGLSNTMREIFGSAGLAVFLCPLIPTTLPGNGTCFPSREDKAQ